MADVMLRGSVSHASRNCSDKIPEWIVLTVLLLSYSIVAGPHFARVMRDEVVNCNNMPV